MTVIYIYVRKLFREKTNEKITNDFFSAFYDLNYGKSSLFCCNGYRHALLKILFYESQVDIQENHLQKKKRKKNVNDFFIAVSLHSYDLNYLNSTKSQLSHQKSEVTFIEIKKFTLSPNFKYLSVEMTKLEAEVSSTSPPPH